MTSLEMTEDRPWWKEPMVWLIAALPATSVVAGFATYFIAAHDPDSLVRADYHKEGLALVEQATAADRRASEMGMVAQLKVADTNLELSLKGLLPVQPPRLGLTVIHPSRANQDIRVVLVRSGDGRYVGALPDLGEGRRNLVLEPEDRVWRIGGQWNAPFAGMTELAAKGAPAVQDQSSIPNPSTNAPISGQN
jgi:hypothetical protein